MKNILSIVIVLLTTLSFANAQDEGESTIKRNAFQPERTNKFFSSTTVKERVDPNFPALPDASPTPSPQKSTYVRPTAKKRFERYLDSAFGVSALITVGAGAAYSQITNSPKEWKRTPEGFARRVGSGYAQGAIGRTITYGLSEAFQLDDSFAKSGQKGFSKRLKHVIAGSFTTRTKNGGYLPDFPHFIGSYTANIIAKETWYPPRYDYKDGLKSGTISVFTRLGINFVREFFFK